MLGCTVTGTRRRSVRVPATTMAWNVSFTPTDCKGHVRTPERLPLKAIQVPAFAPEHCVIAVTFQQPTTSVPRRIWRRIFAANGFPVPLCTVTV